MSNKLPSFQFDDLLHGADVMEEAVREGNRDLLQNCIQLMQQDTADATGTAAAELHLWLGRAEYDLSAVSLGEVDDLRGLLKAFAVDAATAQSIQAEKKARAVSETNRQNAGYRENKLPAAQAEAERRWQRDPSITKKKMARDLERDGYGLSFVYLERQLIKPKC